MQAEITAIRYALTARVPKGWWLEVVWQVRNTAQHRLYLLAKGPIWILDADPLVLNHAVEDPPIAVDPYTDPDMEFAAVEAGAELQLERTYPLPPLELRTPRAVVGRFAVGADPPDPSWRQGHVWDAVRRWQQVLQSAAFVISG